MARTVLISGATGFIGGHLIRSLLARGDRVTVWSRDARKASQRWGRQVQIIEQLASLGRSERVDVIINLAGARILGPRWTQARRRTLVSSRVDTTRALVELCTRLSRPASVFLSASAIGYYGIHGDEPLDEQAPPQPIFQSQLCQEWEAAADRVALSGARVVKLRMGVVLGRDGGALPQLLTPARLGLGAVLGNGTQWISWIHIEDLVRLFEFALEEPEWRGPVNATAPGNVRQEEFQRALARILHRPLWLRVPGFALRAVLGEMAQLLLEGQRVVPGRALASGFVFRHPDLDEALADLLTQKTSPQSSHQ